ncbi:unnamed protein product, partial [Medioppia subpectinata]
MPVSTPAELNADYERLLLELSAERQAREVLDQIAGKAVPLLHRCQCRHQRDEDVVAMDTIDQLMDDYHRLLEREREDRALAAAADVSDGQTSQPLSQTLNTKITRDTNTPTTATTRHKRSAKQNPPKNNSKISDFFAAKPKDTTEPLPSTSAPAVRVKQEPIDDTNGLNHTTAAADDDYDSDFEYNCLECPKRFTTQLSLASHQVNAHNNRAAFRCPKCQWAGINHNSLVKHRYSHTRDEIMASGFNSHESTVQWTPGAPAVVERYVVCGYESVCPKVFKTYMGLFAHVSKEHSIEAYTEYFEKTRQTRGQAVVTADDQLMAIEGPPPHDNSDNERHESNDGFDVNLGSDGNDVSIADNSFSFGTDLLAAPALAADDDSDDAVEYYCQECRVPFATEHCLRKHLGHIHGNAMFPCDHCEFMGVDRAAIKTHRRQCHRELLAPGTRSQSLKTPQLPLVAALVKRKRKRRPFGLTRRPLNGPKVKAHPMLTTGGQNPPPILPQQPSAIKRRVGRPRKCQQPPPPVPTRVTANSGPKASQRRTPWYCVQCLTFWPNELALKKHKAGVHREPAFGCDQCPWNGYTSKQLNRHSLCHQPVGGDGGQEVAANGATNISNLMSHMYRNYSANVLSMFTDPNASGM